MSAKAFNEHFGVLCLLLEMLIEQLVGTRLGEDVMKFFSVLVAVKLTPLLVPHLPVGEGSWDLVSFLLMSEIWKANYTFCFRGSAPWLHM